MNQLRGKIVFTFFILISILLSAQAENEKFAVGVKAGVNIADYSGYLERKAMVVGGIVTYPLTPIVTFQPEVLYSQQGTKEIVYQDGSTRQLKLDYLKLPVAIKMDVYRGLFVLAGPQLSLLVSAKEYENESSVKVTSSYKPIEFSLFVGLGYEFKVGLFCDVRYNYGTSDLIKDQNYNEVYFKGNSQAVTQFTVGYNF